MEEHEEKADDYEQQADELEEHGDRVEQGIDDARSDLESKLSDNEAPGLLKEEEAAPGGAGVEASREGAIPDPEDDDQE